MLHFIYKSLPLRGRLVGVITLLLLFPLFLQAQETLWTVEAEDPATAVTFRGDSIEMTAPKGLTLWYNKPFSGDCTIEYDACVLYEQGDTSRHNRVSDLNCFWKASDPLHPDDIFADKELRRGVFVNCYSLQLYYLGYGGNHNSTTRFRRYDGNRKAVGDASLRPKILTEYTDAEHLLKPNHWYHIVISCQGNRTTYTIDGKTIVDFTDDNPLHKGWFGFRTTLSHTMVRKFKLVQSAECRVQSNTAQPNSALCTLHSALNNLHWIGGRVPQIPVPQTFGLPFNKGELKAKELKKLHSDLAANPCAIGENTQPSAIDITPLAYWEDGSVKWASVSTVVTPKDFNQALTADAGEPEEILKRLTLIASVTDDDNKKTEWSVSLANDCTREIESENRVRRCYKFTGKVGCFPFILRAYIYKGSRQIKLVHTFIYDADQNKDFVSSLGVQISVPLKDELYNRHIAFTSADGKIWTEAVQPLVGRRELKVQSAECRVQSGAAQPNSELCTLNSALLQRLGRRIPAPEAFPERDRVLLREWVSWGRYRLSQLNDMSYTIRKQAKPGCQMVGTFAGRRASGLACLADMSGGMIALMKDFWQAYPSTIEITEACADTAKLTMWLWSPEAERMDLRHYDTEGHGLNSSYEDIQEGMSTPRGIARTSEITLLPIDCYPGPDSLRFLSAELTDFPQLACTPEYLHSKKAFGEWSLPRHDTPLRCQIENRLDSLLNIYKEAIETEHWYGFWNYGDVMHTTTPTRNVLPRETTDNSQWLYDVGGYAWDNTELATNLWLWYSFLRTGSKDTWRMAEAMFRHNSEVDVYHCGEMAGLGTRHNVSHWGCGAKEARISQALWNRFYYYLTGDERAGELMEEVKDADLLLYTLDPMRLAQPRSLYPCTAPARLRIGPDWLAYAANWFTHWERTAEKKYLDKLHCGISSINAMPNGIFTGAKALGYYPDTGRITWEGDPQMMNTNHLLPIMGGFEFALEMENSLTGKAKSQWHDTWLRFCREYRETAWRVSKSKFRIPRLAAYAYKHTGEKQLLDSALEQLLKVRMTEFSRFSTNDAATWGLDAIYILTTLPK